MWQHISDICLCPPVEKKCILLIVISARTHHSYTLCFAAWFFVCRWFFESHGLSDSVVKGDETLGFSLWSEYDVFRGCRHPGIRRKTNTWISHHKIFKCFRACLDAHVHLNPHVLEWNVVQFHSNTCGLKWIHMHPNKVLVRLNTRMTEWTKNSRVMDR